jgi:dolichol-phosphate mannosyltransferase
VTPLPEERGRRSRGRRLLKFSIVGAAGIAVQLATLAALTAMAINYLLATVLAVEMAILHNFFWHRRFTWPDRLTRVEQGVTRSLIRFHLGNGLISAIGNLVMMRVLVGFFRLPVVAANISAITICWLANFFVCDYWIFSP